MGNLGTRIADPRWAQRIVVLACAIYAASFFVFYPQVVTNDDESMYRRQAALILRGTSTILQTDPLSGKEIVHHPSTYPAGTALAMAPLVALGGWRAGYLVPCLGLMTAVLVLGQWLREQGRSPLFALLLLGYPPALVMGRVAMSDVPSTGIVTLGLWLFFRGLDRGWRPWLGSGFAAGLSMLFRDSNPILFTPFFVGAVLRRDRHWWALLVGGLLGLSARVAAAWFFFGDPLYGRSKYHLALGTLHERLPIYLLATLVFVPGGLVLALCARGRRWLELRIAVASFFTAYLIQTYYTFSTSFLKNTIITPRYLLPLVPLLAWGSSESMPRLWGDLKARVGPARRAALERWQPRVIALWAAGVVTAALLVHPLFWRWSQTQARIRDAIREVVDPQAVIVTNYMASRKFFDELEFRYRPVDTADIRAEQASELAQRYGQIQLVLVDRSDSEYWRELGRYNADFVAAVTPEPRLLIDEQMSPTDRLRIWRVQAEPLE